MSLNSEKKKSGQMTLSKEKKSHFPGYEAFERASKGKYIAKKKCKAA